MRVLVVRKFTERRGADTDAHLRDSKGHSHYYRFPWFPVESPMSVFHWESPLVYMLMLISFIIREFADNQTTILFKVLTGRFILCEESVQTVMV
jgi:hypothetical protein